MLSALRAEVPKKAKVLAAVSGGKDSVSLLLGLDELRTDLGIEISVAHVDHRLRAISAQDAEFVRNLAFERSLPFHLKVLEPPPPKANIEAWMRRERYRFFSQVLLENGIDLVLTAHTADDCAETILMRLVSNKQPYSITRFDIARRCLRPLLLVEREQIDQYLHSKGAQWVEDESNLNIALLRNRVRHIVMPLLKENFGQQITGSLARQAISLSEDLKLVRRLVRVHARVLKEREFGSEQWYLTFRTYLRKLDERLGWRLVELCFKPMLGWNLGELHSKRVVDFILRYKQELHLPGGWRLNRERRTVCLRQADLRRYSRE